MISISLKTFMPRSAFNWHAALHGGAEAKCESDVDCVVLWPLREAAIPDRGTAARDGHCDVKRLHPARKSVIASLNRCAGGPHVVLPFETLPRPAAT